MTKIADFLTDRLVEELRNIELRYYSLEGARSADVGARKKDIELKLKIVEWHENWPVLVTTPMEFKTVPTNIQLSGAYVAHADSVAPMDYVKYKMSQQMNWLTEQEYVKRFGEDPPTAPILRMMADAYIDHPDYQEAIS